MSKRVHRWPVRVHRVSSYRAGNTSHRGTLDEEVAPSSCLTRPLAHSASSVDRAMINLPAQQHDSTQHYHLIIVIIIIALETLSPINTTGITFFSELSRRLISVLGDPRETS